MFAFEKVFPTIPSEAEPTLICGETQEKLVKRFMEDYPKSWSELIERSLVFKRFGGHAYTKVTLFEVNPVTREVIEIKDSDFDFSNRKIKITNNTIASYSDDFDFCYNNIFVIFS